MNQIALASTPERFSFGSLAVVAYFLLPFGYFFLLSSYNDRISLAAVGPYFTALGLVVLAAGMLTVILKRRNVQRIDTSPTALLLYLLFSYSFVASAIGIEPLKSLFYSTIGLFIVFCFHNIHPELQKQRFRSFSLASYGLAAYLIFLIFYHETTFFRTVGGIQPNQWAKAGIVVMILAFLADSRLKYFAFLFSLFCAILASSRGGIVFNFIFISSYLFLALRTGHFVLVTASVLSASIGFLGILAFLDSPLLDIIITDILAIDDPDRGVGSGLTGRTEYWQIGLTLVTDNILFGRGLSSTVQTDDDFTMMVGSHQGYLNLILDLGLIGLFIFLSAAGLAAFTYLRRAIKREDLAYSGATFSFILGYLALMLIDPFYINFGFPMSTLFLYLVATAASCARCGATDSMHPDTDAYSKRIA